MDGSTPAAPDRAGRLRLGGWSATAQAAQKPQPNNRLHPILEQGAKDDPGKRVRVIVQRTDSRLDSQALARSVGGTVVDEFPFIKSVVLEVPLGAVKALDRNPRIRAISPNGKVQRQAIDVSALRTVFDNTVQAPQTWNNAKWSQRATGTGVTLAVVDTGVDATHPDLAGRVTPMSVNGLPTQDNSGHGTHVAGIINGRDPLGRYLGVAPNANVLSVRVADETGVITTANLLDALQWVFNNRLLYNIRIINLSLSSSVPESYVTSPVDAAVEQLWLSGVVVVAAASNRGNAEDAAWYAPGNDPYVITVGALDDNQTPWTTDDSLAGFSGRGHTLDGYAKPEVVAPGRRIVAPLARGNVTFAREFPDRITDGAYIRLSGTSMSAPVVSGAIALILQRYPQLTPDQVKWLLMKTASAYPGQTDSAGMINLPRAMQTAASAWVGMANLGLIPGTGIAPGSSTLWGQGYWEQGYWEQGYCDLEDLD